MGDFERIDRKRPALTKRGDFHHNDDGTKKRCFCLVEGCLQLWTHSDTPGGGLGYCGYHYHARLGHDHVKAWEARDALAREDERRARAGAPRYTPRAKPDVLKADSVAEYARRVVDRSGEPA